MVLSTSSHPRAEQTEATVGISPTGTPEVQHRRCRKQAGPDPLRLPLTLPRLERTDHRTTHGNDATEAPTTEPQPTRTPTTTKGPGHADSQ